MADQKLSALTDIEAPVVSTDELYAIREGVSYKVPVSSLAIAKAQAGLGNVDNTSDANKPVSTATQTALDTKQASDADLTAIAGLSPSNDDILQRKAGAWTNRTPAQVKTDLALAKGDVGLGNVDNTSDANKPVSTATQTALDAKAALASPALTGTPTAPTAAHATSTTQVATTAFVRAARPVFLEITGTTLTLTKATHEGLFLWFSHASGCAVTVNGAEFAANDECYFHNAAAGEVTFVEGTGGIAITKADHSIAQGDTAGIGFISGTAAFLYGALTAP
jgi:hypothetical protein